MLRRVVRVLRPVILIFAVLLFFAWLLDDSKTFQECIQAEQHQTTAHDFKNDIATFDFPISSYKRCVGLVFETHDKEVVASFTVLLALVTFLLWLATRDLVQGAEDTARRQLRAYISVRLTSYELKNQYFTTRLAITNTGQTPAHDMTIVTGSNVLLHPIMSERDIPKGEIEGTPSTETLGAGVLTYSKAHLEPHEWTQEEFLEAKNGNLRIYAWGVVKYRDVFGKPHVTRFCSYYTWEGNHADYPPCRLPPSARQPYRL